jgi:hypothetical protein
LDHAVRERGSLRDDNFAHTLRECESCRYDSAIPTAKSLRLVQALFDYALRLKLTRPQLTRSQQEKKAWKL